LVVFPNAKINIGLRVLNKREDGYHNIETAIFPIGWQDILEITPTKGITTFKQTGLLIEGKKEQNIVWKAFKLMEDQFSLPSVHIHLHKSIPSGAGLGGGSSNAAFTITLIDSLFDLNLNQETMEGLAATLGSDCPFFIRNKPAIATNTGTTLSNIEYTLRKKWILVLCPAIHSSTENAYSKMNPDMKSIELASALSQPVEDWENKIFNDFEVTIFETHPEIKELKDMLINNGAEYASLSGSGSSVYGIFRSPPPPPPVAELKVSWSGPVFV